MKQPKIVQSEKLAYQEPQAEVKKIELEAVITSD